VPRTGGALRKNVRRRRGRPRRPRAREQTGAAGPALRVGDDLRRAWRHCRRRATNLVPRVPLLAGTRIAVVDTAADGVVLRPPTPGKAIADVGAAVREAIRFPLAGEAPPRLVPPGGTAPRVVEPPPPPLPPPPAAPP